MEKTVDTSDALTVDDVARMLRVTRNTVYELRNRGL
jgi:hypothetical protein